MFDTLIARRCVEPYRIFHRLETESGLAGLAVERIQADVALDKNGAPYGLADIWGEVQRRTNLDHATIARLQTREMQLEHEEVIPIVEMLDQVRDGDVLISDTYLSQEALSSLLRRVGFNRAVGIVVSNAGKRSGRIWPFLLERAAIEQHVGDNVRSDGESAHAAGIRSVIYAGSGRSSVERYLSERGCTSLANLMRQCRLANPFDSKRPMHRHLWNMTADFNFPLLFLASLLVEGYCRRCGVDELLFVSRDCFLWHQLHRRMFPRRSLRYLYSSRKCLYNTTARYEEYFRSIWRPTSAIVDLFSTGASWARFFGCLELAGRCFFIGMIDNFSYTKVDKRLFDRLMIDFVLRTSDFGAPLHKPVEMLNYAPHPSVEDVVWQPTHCIPLLRTTAEYDLSLPEAAAAAMRKCIDCLDSESLPNGYAHEELIRTLVQSICNDARILSIYPNHHASDTAYEKELRLP